MKRVGLRIGVFLLLIWSAQRISASITWENLLILRKTQPELVQGLLDGFQTSNVELQRRKQERLYCPPGKLVLTPTILCSWLKII